MNGMNLSGKPGIVQPMQMPPTFGQPPMPAIQPRLGTLQMTTGPQQPTFTWHLGELQSLASLELPPQVVREAHATRRVARHGVDTAERRTGTGRDHRPCPGRQLVD